MALTDTTYEVGEIRTDRGLFIDKGNQRFDIRHPDFEGGAKDGVVSTSAIQAAFTAQANALDSKQTSSGGVNGAFVGTLPPVYFPPGHWKIDGEITASAYARIEFAPGAILQQTDNTKRHIVAPAYLFEVSGGVFVGGTRALDLSNENTDATAYRVYGCEFHLQQDYAIHTLGTTFVGSPSDETTLASGATAGGSTISVASATGLAVDEGIIVTNDDGEHHATWIEEISGTTITLREPVPDWWEDDKAASTGAAVRTGTITMSASLLVENCRFIRPKRVLFSSCDDAEVRDCWVHIENNNFDEGRAAFVNASGNLYINSMFGVPQMGTGGSRTADVRWVDNYQWLHVFRTRFGGEDSGMAPIYNYADYAEADRANAPQIVVRDSFCACGPAANDDAAVVNIVTGVPGVILLDGLWGLSDSAFVANIGDIDLDAYFDSITNKGFEFYVGPIARLSGGGFPDQFKPFLTFSSLSSLYTEASVPTVGRWTQGQFRRNSAPVFGGYDRVVNVTTGEPGSWGYAGKVSPFPIGPQATTEVTSSTRKVSFTIPSGVQAFAAIVTMTCNPNTGASSEYRTIRVDAVSMIVDFSSTVNDHLQSTELHAPTPDTLSAPTLSSLHFGTGDSGNATREHAAGGSFTLVYGNCDDSATVSVELLHFGG